MNYQSILYTFADGVARLTLNRPDKLNSFTGAMHAEVRDALARVRADGARVLVLTGAGRGFCAGQDLSDRAVAPGGKGADLGESIEKNYAPLVLALVLGDKAEDAFRQTMLASKGDLSIFWSNGLVGTITVLAIVLLFWPAIVSLCRRMRSPKLGQAMP